MKILEAQFHEEKVSNYASCIISDDKITRIQTLVDAITAICYSLTKITKIVTSPVLVMPFSVKEKP